MTVVHEAVGCSCYSQGMFPNVWMLEFRRCEVAVLTTCFYFFSDLFAQIVAVVGACMGR